MSPLAGLAFLGPVYMGLPQLLNLGLHFVSWEVRWGMKFLENRSASLFRLSLNSKLVRIVKAY